MTHLNSAVKLLDRAAEKFNDKIAISDEWSEISFSELQRKGKAVGTALAKTTPQGYMPAPVMVYLKKSISCLVCFMGAMYSANPYVPTAYDMPANRIQKIVDSLQGLTFWKSVQYLHVSKPFSHFVPSNIILTNDIAAMVVFLLNITLVYSYCIKSSNIFPVFIDVSSLLKNLISASSSFFRFSPLILTVAKELEFCTLCFIPFTCGFASNIISSS